MAHINKPQTPLAFTVQPVRDASRRVFRVNWKEADGNFSVEVWVPDRFLADIALKAIRNSSGVAYQSVRSGTIHDQQGFGAVGAEVLSRGGA